jgi:flavin reductase (DIM6/NTAB) family NADH-FMN oxidoreductase RutF
MIADKRKFRALMGRFVTGVTVIATHAEGRIAAMTANAITAVSLEPLILLVCVRNESTMLPLLKREQLFSVNVLAADQHAISSHYGTRGAMASPVHWAAGELGVPVLIGSNATFTCSVDQETYVGDHTVIFGAVKAMSAADSASPALVFAAGRYAELNLSS